MSELQVFNSVKDFIAYRDALATNVKIGFVPTMGALHEGHASLLRRASRENDLSVLSIFVNPTQFNNADDLKKYPRTWEADVSLAKNNGVGVIISPTYDELYADNYRFKLHESAFSEILCGAHRPGHFDGVLTVVMKLFQIVNPHRSYFGEKDYQQLQLIKDMSETFFLRNKVVACPTLREHDGLAMSSRNVRLTPAGRERAPLIYRAISQRPSVTEAKDFLEKNAIEVEYLEEHFGRRFIAAYIDGVRLIDNVSI